MINNYTGAIGRYPIHISIQYYDTGGGGNIKGVYYYDKYRTPIPLYGRKTSDSIELCEITNAKEYNDHINEGKEYDSSLCPFKLIDGEDTLHGVWKNEKSTLDIILNRAESLTNNTITSSSDNSIEIPFWGQTKLHNFIGVYENTEDGVSVNKINVINKKSGVIEQTIDPQLHDCNFGFYMTSVYQNIESGNAQSDVWLNCYSTGKDYSVIYKYNKISKSYTVVK